MRAGLARPNLRVLKSTDVVQVLTAAARRPASDRQYPLIPVGLLQAIGLSLPWWALVIYLVWW